MTVHVIGSNGFIGKSIKREALTNSSLQFYSSKAIRTEKSNLVDLDNVQTWTNVKIVKGDCLIYLPWKHLPNYNKQIHLTNNLCQSINFISQMIDRGITKIICSGTCYEYGLQDGMLSENLIPKPNNCYAIAKDLLRQALEVICNQSNIELIWLRIFFPFGEGQNPNSLLPSLQRAIENGDKSFDIGDGSLIRDYIEVSKVAKIILSLAQAKNIKGIYNIGSGTPVTIYEFLSNYIKRYNHNISINPGVYPKRDYEPDSFWADMSKLNKIEKILN